MAPSESPAVARRRVRLAVRTAREAADLTQGQVAEAMEWSHSKVMRIESGEVTIAPNDLRPLLAYLGVTDRATVDDLVQSAKVSRRRQAWWAEPSIREHLTFAMRQLIQYETEAAAIRHFSTTVVPGPLQTAEYASAILNSYRHELSDEVFEIRLSTRMRRRSELLGRRHPPEIYLLLDESVVRRRVGGAKVMAAQLADLSRLVAERRIVVRVLPFTVDAPLPLFGSYDILELAGDQGAVLYRESHLEDELVDDPAKVARHRGVFDHLWAASLDESTSTDLIAESAKALADQAPGGASVSPTTTSARPRRRRHPG